MTAPERDIIEQLGEVTVKPAEVKARLEEILEKWLEHRKAEHQWEKTPPSKFRIELDVRAQGFLHSRRWTGFKPKKLRANAVNKFARIYKTWYTIKIREEALDWPRPTRKCRGQRLAAKWKSQR